MNHEQLMMSNEQRLKSDDGGREVREEEREGVEEEGKQDGRLRRRLKGVQKRKRAQRSDFECEAMALKMRLVKVEEDSGR